MVFGGEHPKARSSEEGIECLHDLYAYRDMIDDNREWNKNRLPSRSLISIKVMIVMSIRLLFLSLE